MSKTLNTEVMAMIVRLIDRFRQIYPYDAEVDAKLRQLHIAFQREMEDEKKRVIQMEMEDLAVANATPDYGLIGDERIRQEVYNFYKQEITSFYGRNVLDSVAFQTEALVRGSKLRSSYHEALLTSDPQQGKTLVMIALSALFLCVGHTPVLIQPYKANLTQTAGRMKDSFARLQKHLASLGIKTNLFDRVCTNRNIRLPGAVLLVHHYNHLYSALKATRGHRFVLIIDEAHKIGGFKYLPNEGNFDNVHNEKVKYDRQLALMKKCASQIVFVTATPQDVMACTNMMGKNIALLPKPQTYQSITKAEFRTIPDEKRESYQAGGRSIQLPPSFLKCMRRVQRRHIPGQPPIALIRTESKNIDQIELAKFFHWPVAVNKLHSKILRKEWLVITHNQDGLRLYVAPSWRSEVFTIGNRSYSYGDGYFDFARISPEQLLDALSHHPRQPNCLAFVAWYTCVEGISYTTTHQNNKKWRLSDLYFYEGRPKTNTSCATAVQSLSRVCGNYDLTFVPRVYCSQSNKEKIVKSKNVTDCVIEECIKRPYRRLRKTMKRTPIPENRFHARHHKMTKTKELYGLIPNPNEDMEEKVLREKSIEECFVAVQHPSYSDEERYKELVREYETEEKERYGQVFCLYLGEVKDKLGETLQYLWKQLLEKPINTWENASQFYREKQRDRQNTWHLLDMAKKLSQREVSEDELVFCIRCKSKNGSIEIKLSDEGCK